MVATKYFLLLFLVLLLNIYSVGAQECGNCKEPVKVIQFDLDIRVPKPDSTEGTSNLWPQWNNLFMIAQVIGSKLKSPCIKVYIPPAVDTGNVQIGKVGNFVNLPDNPLISKDLSVYGDYLLTGIITSQGENCTLRAEIQTACSRKIVATADLSFSLSTVINNVATIAQQVVDRLTPLADKIKQFELDERKKDRALSLFQMSPGDPIIVTPQKKMLKAGESTSFTIEVKDCDGQPLAGREIYFNETSFAGLKVSGTIGGKVSTTKVITDANGKATATFTLNNGAKEAFISVHSPGKNVKGCNSLLFGDAPINIKYNYSGHVVYTMESSANCYESGESGCLRSEYHGNLEQTVKYVASFYIDQEKSSDLDIAFSNENDGDGLVPNNMEAASFEFVKEEVRKGTIICESVGKGDQSIQHIIQNIDGELKGGFFRFSYRQDFSSANIDMIFNTKTSSSFEQTLLPTSRGTTSEETGWNVAFDTMIDKKFSVKKVKSGNRTKYTGEGSREADGKCSGTTEKIKIVVYEE